MREAFEALRAEGGERPVPLPPVPPAPAPGVPPPLVATGEAAGEVDEAVAHGPPPDVAPTEQPEPTWQPLPTWQQVQDTQEANFSVLKRVLASPSARELGAPAGLALQSALYGITIGDLEGARRRLRELRGPMAEELAAAQHEHRHLSVWWQAVRELLGLPDDFPVTPRTAMARAVLHLNFSSAGPRLRDFRKRKPEQAALAVKALAVRPGLLAEQFGADLHQPGRHVVEKGALGSFVLLLLFFLLRTSDCWLDPDRTSRDRSPGPAVAVASVEEELLEESLDEGWKAVRRRCGSGRAAQWECDYVVQILEDVEAGRCSSASRGWAEYRAERPLKMSQGGTVSSSLFEAALGAYFHGCEVKP